MFAKHHWNVEWTWIKDANTNVSCQMQEQIAPLKNNK